ncbi:MAG: MBL fold metallo-hydrolase [Bacteroidetes bacterium]|nr:MBL fold metallo-hydrolase [Bacteroidota bacterium]
MIKFIPLGGADDIGASCYYLNISGTGILIDCGIHPRKTGLDSIPDFSLLDFEPLDAVLISHAHQDHVGALPFLIKKFPHVKIYTTPQTKEILNLTLHNAVSIIGKQLDSESGIKPYTHGEVSFLIQSIQDYSYDENFIIKGLLHDGERGISVIFKDAGHILGSASIFIESEGHKIFFTGDINLSPQAIMSGAEFPKIEIDTLITETTYGSTESTTLPSWEDESKRLAKFINDITISGGSVLIPVFSLGKMQEILTVISNMMYKGKLIRAEIYTAGLGKKISHIYDLHKYKVKRNMPDFEIKSIPQKPILFPHFYSEIKRSPGIVLASSGMLLKNTVSFELANYWVRQNNYGIAVVGYMDPETPGYRVSNLTQGDEITMLDSTIINKALVKKFDFTSHSKREEIVLLGSKLKARNIVLVHGEESSRDWIGHELLKQSKKVKLYSPVVGSAIILE